MATVNAIGLPKDSPFRIVDRILLLENPRVENQVEEESEDSSDKDEGSESPESKDLSRQIDSHVVVLDNDQLRTFAPTSDTNVA